MQNTLANVQEVARATAVSIDHILWIGALFPSELPDNASVRRIRDLMALEDRDPSLAPLASALSQDDADTAIEEMIESRIHGFLVTLSTAKPHSFTQDSQGRWGHASSWACRETLVIYVEDLADVIPRMQPFRDAVISAGIAAHLAEVQPA